MSVAVGEEWLCDQCTAINSSSVFPCHTCGYPLRVDPRQPSLSDLEYDGLQSGTYVALDAPAAHPGKAKPCLHTAESKPAQDGAGHDGSGDNSNGITLSPLNLNLEDLNPFLCPVCFLDSKEAPCVLCGFDPVSDEAPEQDDEATEYVSSR